MNELAEKLIKLDEGWKDRIYLDTKGKVTGGFGHNFSDNKLSTSVGQLLFTEDFIDAEQEVRHIYGDMIDEIGDARQAVLLDLSFNMSYQAVEGFHNFIKAVQDKNWETAASELQFKDSKFPEQGFTKWWNDVKSRGPRLQKILRTGELSL